MKLRAPLAATIALLLPPLLAPGIAHAGSSIWTFKNVHSGKCLEVYYWDHIGSPVHQWDCNGGANQKWWVNWKDGGATIQNVELGLCLDDYAWNTDNGADAVLWPCNDAGNQLWDVYSLAPPASSETVIKNMYSGKVLDVFGFATNNGAKVVQWELNWLNNQQWMQR